MMPGRVKDSVDVTDVSDITRSCDQLPTDAAPDIMRDLPTDLRTKMVITVQDVPATQEAKGRDEVDGLSESIVRISLSVTQEDELKPPDSQGVGPGVDYEGVSELAVVNTESEVTVAGEDAELPSRNAVEKSDDSDGSSDSEEDRVASAHHPPEPPTAQVDVQRDPDGVSFTDNGYCIKRVAQEPVEQGLDESDSCSAESSSSSEDEDEDKDEVKQDMELRLQEQRLQELCLMLKQTTVTTMEDRPCPAALGHRATHSSMCDRVEPARSVPNFIKRAPPEGELAALAGQDGNLHMAAGNMGIDLSTLSEYLRCQGAIDLHELDPYIQSKATVGGKRTGGGTIVQGSKYVRPSPGHTHQQLFAEQQTGNRTTTAGFSPTSKQWPLPSSNATPSGMNYFTPAMPLGIAPHTMGMAPPTVGMVPPTLGMVPPTVGMAPPTGGMAPPTVGMAPPTVGMAPPIMGMIPPSVDMAPPPMSMAPPTVGVATSNGGVAPPTVVAANPRGTSGGSVFHFSAPALAGEPAESMTVHHSGDLEKWMDGFESQPTAAAPRQIPLVAGLSDAYQLGAPLPQFVAQAPVSPIVSTSVSSVFLDAASPLGTTSSPSPSSSSSSPAANQINTMATSPSSGIGSPYSMDAQPPSNAMSPLEAPSPQGHAVLATDYNLLAPESHRVSGIQRLADFSTPVQGMTVQGTTVQGMTVQGTSYGQQLQKNAQTSPQLKQPRERLSSESANSPSSGYVSDQMPSSPESVDGRLPTRVECCLLDDAMELIAKDLKPSATSRHGTATVVPHVQRQAPFLPVTITDPNIPVKTSENVVGHRRSALSAKSTPTSKCSRPLPSVGKPPIAQPQLMQQAPQHPTVGAVMNRFQPILPKQAVQPPFIQLQQNQPDRMIGVARVSAGMPVDPQQVKNSGQYSGNHGHRPAAPVDEDVKACVQVAHISLQQLKDNFGDRDTLLMIAVAKESVSLVKAFLGRYERERLLEQFIDKADDCERTPVFLATCMKSEVIVKELVQRGANVNNMARITNSQQQPVYMCGPLHYAATRGLVPCLGALLQSPTASVNARDARGDTPLHCAILAHDDKRKINNKPAIELLLQSGADLNQGNPGSGKTPFHYVIERRNEDLLTFILDLVPVAEKTQLTRTETFANNTALHIAVGLKGMEHESKKRVVRGLMRIGADPSKKNNTNDSARNLTSDPEIIDILSGSVKARHR